MAVSDQLLPPRTTSRAVVELRPNPLNPRGELDATGLEELATSIRAQGILQPLLVTPDGLVVAGHRRLAAAKLAGLTEVPVLERELSTAEQVEIMLVENVQREALTALQEARAFRHLLDAGYKKSDVIRRVGVTGARIQARLQLLQLDPVVQGRFDRSELPLTLVPVLVKVGDADQQRRLATIAARRSLTVPQLERIVERGAGALAKPPPRAIAEAPAPPPSDGSATRKAALAVLEASGARTISLDRLAKLFAATCCACGMSFSADICSACPLLEAMQAIQREVA